MIHTANARHETSTKNNTSKMVSLRRPTATAPGADSELLFLIDFSATTYPGPGPASPHGRVWLAGWHPPRARGDTHHGVLPSCSTTARLLHREGEIQALSARGIGRNVLQLFSLEISIHIAVCLLLHPDYQPKITNTLLIFYFYFFLNPFLDCFCCFYGLTCTASL